MSSHSLRTLFGVVVLLVTLGGQGCAKVVPKTPADRAEAVVEQFLYAWSNEEAPDRFAASHPGISVSDPDWEAGERLLSYLSIETKQTGEKTSGFRCRVALSLRDRRGNTVDKEAMYEIVPGEKCVITRMQLAP
jgi:hypothetical protein